MNRLLPVFLVVAALCGAFGAPKKPPPPHGPPPPSTGIQDTQTNAALFEGMQSFKLNRWADAIKALDRAVKENPKNDTAWMYLGLAHMQLFHWDDAIRALLGVVSVNTRSDRAWVLLGQCEMERGNYEKAREYVRRVLTFDGRSFYAYYALGVIDYKEGKLPNALTNFEHSRALYAEFPPTWYNIAVCNYNQHSMNNALARIGKAVTLDPKNTKFLFLHGWYAFMNNDPSTGFLEFRHLFEEDKRNSSWTDTARAFLSMRSANLTEARKYLDEALRKDPENVKALVLNGLVLLKENKKDDAVKALQEALELDPLDWDARDALQHLGVAPPAPHAARLPGKKPTQAAQGTPPTPLPTPSPRPNDPPPPPGVPR